MATHSVHRHIKRKRKVKVKQKSQIDKLIYFAVFIGPLLTLPQVYTIWMEDQKGVSIVSWVAYLVASVIWLLYGIKHNDKPIILVEIIWISLEILIIVGLLRL
jgi:uncharacterized protein with PQ loop repeat